MNRVFYITGWGFVAICATLLFRSSRPDLYAGAEPAIPFPAGAIGSAAAGWFDSARPRCNALEAELLMRTSPPPDGWEGAGYGASCFALAGRIENARAAILELPADRRGAAAGIVFGIGHPIADMGDDLSAGPIMQLVVEFQPNNYMALYHAGMSLYAIGRSDEATRHLLEFLELYTIEDGWRHNAIEILRRLGHEDLR
jgi:hypothetical protein